MNPRQHTLQATRPLFRFVQSNRESSLRRLELKRNSNAPLLSQLLGANLTRQLEGPRSRLSNPQFWYTLFRTFLEKQHLSMGRYSRRHILLEQLRHSSPRRQKCRKAQTGKGEQLPWFFQESAATFSLARRE